MFRQDVYSIYGIRDRTVRSLCDRDVLSRFCVQFHSPSQVKSSLKGREETQKSICTNNGNFAVYVHIGLKCAKFD